MIREIRICNFGSIREEVAIDCGQLTLIQGTNGSGKTMILQAIALALSPFGLLPRYWCRDTKNRAHVRLELTNSTFGDLTIDRYFSVSDKLCRFEESTTIVNGQERHDIEFMRHLVQVVFFEAYEMKEGSRGAHDFLQYCSRLLGFSGRVHGEALRHIAAVLEQVNRRPERSFREVTMREGRLLLRQWDDEALFPLECAGGGDLVKLSNDFALEMAAQNCEYQDTLLLLDDFPTKLSLNDDFAKRYRQMSIPGLQAIMTTVRDDAQRILNPDVLVELSVRNPKQRPSGTQISRVTRASRPELDLIERSIREFEAGHEDQFIETLVVPMLTLLKFKGVRKVAHHGPGELGFDVGPAVREILPGRVSYFGFQVKVGRVNARSGGSGCITELISQIRKMLSTPTLDPTSQTSIRVDYAVAIVSQHLTEEAKRTWEGEFEGERRVLLWDASALASIIFEAGIWPRLPISFRMRASVS